MVKYIYNINHEVSGIYNIHRQPSVSLQGEEHVILADVEPDALQDSQAARLQQQQPAGAQTLTHGQALRHADGLQTLHATQSLVLHEHLAVQTEGELHEYRSQPQHLPHLTLTHIPEEAAEIRIRLV